MKSTSPNEFLQWLCAGAGEESPAPAVASIVAHPDDEVIGAGSRLALLPQASVIHITDGAPRPGLPQ